MEKRKEKKLTNKEIITLVNKGYNSLDKSLETIHDACESQNMEIVASLLEVTRKVAKIYHIAQLAQLQK